MITVYHLAPIAKGESRAASLEARDQDPEEPTPLWVDLLDPTAEELAEVERFVELEFPTEEEMEEVEVSSRLYAEDGALFLTATAVVNATKGAAVDTTPVSFILAGHCLVTIRYLDNAPFRTFRRSVERNRGGFASAADALSAILDAILDRLADILEKSEDDLNAISRAVFQAGGADGGPPKPPPTDPKRPPRHPPPEWRSEPTLKQLLVQIGRDGEINTRVRESLMSLNRLLVFLIRSLSAHSAHSATVSNLKALSRDQASITDYASFLNGRINFLLDAILGLISIEQNQIIKIFSIAAVIFLPPTLVASIYGMNFRFMPELDWPFGYPLALLLMLVAGLVPYLFFRRKGWI